MDRATKGYKPKTTAELSAAERRILSVISNGDYLSCADIADRANVDANSNYVNNCLTKLKRWWVITRRWKVIPIKSKKTFFCLDCYTVCKRPLMSMSDGLICECLGADYYSELQGGIYKDGNHPDSWVPVIVEVSVDFGRLGDAEIALGELNEDQD